MSLKKETKAELIAELSSLEEDKAELEHKIQGLKLYLGMAKTTSDKPNGNGGASARSIDLDIRPDVEKFFAENGNQAVRMKALVDKMVELHPEVERWVIESKMVHVKRQVLQQVGYGMYHLKTPAAVQTETPAPLDEGF